MKMRNLLYVAPLVVLALMAACATQTADARSADQPPDALTNARFYTGTLGTQGIFSGKLICISCDLRPGDAAKAQCAKEGHKLALEIPGDPTIHPLLPGDAEAFKQLKAAPHGGQVTINGTLFPDLGVIVVAGVTAK
jgi:hypothetical protein